MKDTAQIIQPDIIELRVSYVNKILGMNFDAYKIKNLLIKAGMDSEIVDKEHLKVFIPPYRTDILHEIDIAEDIAIAYGYENFSPEIPKIWTIGEEDKFQRFCNKIRNLMIGLNFQETMSLILTNRENLFKRMNYEGDVVETKNALSTEHNVIRNYLLPSLMSFLETNKTKGYPQRIFEIGWCVEKIENKFKEVLKLGGVIADTKANFSEIKAVVEGMLFSITDSSNVKILETEKGFFINGRAAKILIKNKEVGFFGEISPYVIENFNIEVPVTGFEINLNMLNSLLND